MDTAHSAELALSSLVWMLPHWLQCILVEVGYKTVSAEMARTGLLLLGEQRFFTD